MLLKKSEIKKLIRGEGYRISPESYEGINRAVESTIKQMLVQVANDNMKTLMMQHTGAKTKTIESDPLCTFSMNFHSALFLWTFFL